MPFMALFATVAVVRVLPAQSPSPWHEALNARIGPSDSQPGDADILRAMGAEMTLGRPERVALLLERHGISNPDFLVEKLAIEASVSYGSGDYARSGELYADAAGRATGRQRGVLSARAGDALARAARTEAAAVQYAAARGELRAIAGWLALREAQVTADTAVAFALLEQAPLAARPLVPRVRGEFYALAGDTTRAVVILAGAGVDGRAAALALAQGDTANARQLAYRALRSADTVVSNAGIRLASGAVPPGTAEEFLQLGRALRRQSPARAAALVGEAYARDSSPVTALLWGDVLGESGNHASALVAYGRAARGGGAEATQAELSRARTLIRLRRPAGAFSDLSGFVARHPDHPSIPLAMFLMADLSNDAGRRAESDSLYRVVMTRWPGNDYASQSRIRLATRALLRGDTARAVELYGAEADARGPQQFVSRYLLGNLARARGDSMRAAEHWAALAGADSLGYYGSLARSRLGLPLPAIAPATAAPGVPVSLAPALEQLDLLVEVGFAQEATTLVDWLVAGAGAGDDALDLAEALIERGRTTQAINLGWRATRTRTLNDPRVLRVIYPWPLRNVLAAEAREFGVDPYLLAALVRQESGFDITARSRAGARGLMQVMPATARQAARRMGLEWSDHLLHVPDANLHVGAAHLSMLLRHYQGDLVPALAAYNAGMTPVTRWRRFPEARDPALFVERIPYPETRGYVRSVLRNWTIYRALYPEAPLP